MKLRLWNLDGLGEDLRDDRLNESTKAAYLAVSVVLGMVMGSGGLLQMAGQPNGLLIWMAMAGCYGLGLLLVFQRNQAGDGAHFIERYICLGVPAYARMLCLVYGSYLVLGTVARDWVTSNSVAVWYSLSLPSLAAFFWWVWHGISVAAGGEPQGEV